jgi:SAM-dependent methyltransferase
MNESRIQSGNISYLLDTEEALQREKGRLVRQAEVFSRVEFSVFRETQLCFDRILDLGCGNGAFLARMGRAFHSREVIGYERNPDLIAQARDLHPDLRVLAGDLLDSSRLQEVVVDFQPTVILMRFVLQHLNPDQRGSILKVLAACLPAQASVVIVDAEDSRISCTHANASIGRAVDRVGRLQADRGGDRNVGALLRAELATSGLLTSLDRLCAITTNNTPAEEFIPVIARVWRSCPDPGQREQVAQEVDELERWMLTMSGTPGFEFSLPLRILVASRVR